MICSKIKSSYCTTRIIIFYLLIFYKTNNVRFWLNQPLLKSHMLYGCSCLFNILHIPLRCQTQICNNLLNQFIAVTFLKQYPLNALSCLFVIAMNEQITSNYHCLFLQAKYLLKSDNPKTQQIFKAQSTAQKLQPQTKSLKGSKSLSDWQGSRIQLEQLQEVHFQYRLDIIAKTIEFVKKINDKLKRGFLKIKEREIHLERAQFYICLQRYDQAVGILKKMHLQQPYQKDALMKLCEALQKMEKAEQVCFYNFKLIQLFPSESEHYLKQARSLKKINKFKQALQILQRVISKNQKCDPIFYYQTGKVCNILGQKDQAHKYFSYAKQIGQNSQGAYFQMAKLYNYCDDTRRMTSEHLYFSFKFDPDNELYQIMLQLLLAQSNLKGNCYKVFHPNRIIKPAYFENHDFDRQIVRLKIKTFDYQGLRLYFNRYPIKDLPRTYNKIQIIKMWLSVLKQQQCYDQAVQYCRILRKQEEKFVLEYELLIGINLLRANRVQQASQILGNIQKGGQRLEFLLNNCSYLLCEFYSLFGLHKQSIEIIKRNQLTQVGLFLTYTTSLLRSFTALGFMYGAHKIFVKIKFDQVEKLCPEGFLKDQCIQIIRWGICHGIFDFSTLLLEKVQRILNYAKKTCNSKYLKTFEDKLDRCRQENQQRKLNIRRIQLKFNPQ